MLVSSFKILAAGDWGIEAKALVSALFFLNLGEASSTAGVESLLVIILALLSCLISIEEAAVPNTAPMMSY